MSRQAGRQVGRSCRQGRHDRAAQGKAGQGRAGQYRAGAGTGRIRQGKVGQVGREGEHCHKPDYVLHSTAVTAVM